MTMQEYFDKTVAHLRSMEYRASRDGLCVYLTDDGRKCAVGVHIPDGHPGQYYSGSASGLIKKHPDLVGVAIPDVVGGLSLAMTLQSAHDDECWGDGGFDGECELEDIAANYGLTYTPPETADV